MLEVRPSGPAALPGLSLDSCFATPLTDMVISVMDGKLRDLGRISFRTCFNLRGIRLVKIDWNLALRMFAFSTVAVWLMPFDFRQLISLLSDFCCFTNVYRRLFGRQNSEFLVFSSVTIDSMYWL